ncbi:MAG: PQQ-binding-like beta-propeller repeat protein [Planctomycetes bacterium]|nr:PQQ-binding-like beta-propeller repeat protein [Planctomycetota bacterium]
MKLTALIFIIVAFIFPLQEAHAASKKQADTWSYRGNGQGKFLDAQGPLKWSKTSKDLIGLRSQADYLETGEAKNDASAGFISEWLVLGPVAEDAVDFTVKPKKGDKAGAATWNLLKVQGSIAGIANAKQGEFYFFHAVIGSPHDMTYGFKLYDRGSDSFTRGKLTKRWLNGEKLGHGTLNLKKGFNPLLMCLKVEAGKNHTPGILFNIFSTKVDPDSYQSKNIKWSVHLPQPRGAGQRFSWKWASVAEPIIIGNKLIALVDPQTALCYEKKSGELLWARSCNYADVLSKEEIAKKQDVAKQIAALQIELQSIDKKIVSGFTDVDMVAKVAAEKEIYKLAFKINPKKYYKPDQAEAGIAGLTPCSDGKNVYVQYSTGVVVCYDLSGAQQWVFHHTVKGRHHGYASSPCVFDGRLYIYANGMRALDCKTGKQLWHNAEIVLVQISSIIPLKLANTKVLVLGNGTFVDPKTGKTLHMGVWNSNQAAGDYSSIAAEKNSIVLSHFYGINRISNIKILTYANNLTAPAKTIAIERPLSDHPESGPEGHCYVSAPLLHNGIVYHLRTSGYFFAADAKTGKDLYAHDLNLDGWASRVRGSNTASLTLAGDNIYVWGGAGTCVILKAGKTFKELGRNKIQQTVFEKDWRMHPDSTISNPVFDGKHMYYKSTEVLYCIGES